MIINDLSNLEDIPANQLILGGAVRFSVLGEANALVLGPNGYTSTQVTIVRSGSSVFGQASSVAAGGYFAQSSSSVLVTSRS